MTSKINPALAPLLRPIDGLWEDPENARGHDEENIRAIKASYAESGQQKPIVVMPSGMVVDGNGQLQAALALGWDEIACVPFDGSAEQAEIYGIAANRTAELATWNDAVLAGKLARMRDAGIDLEERLAFDAKTVVQFMAAAKPPPSDEKEESPPVMCPTCGRAMAFNPEEVRDANPDL